MKTKFFTYLLLGLLLISYQSNAHVWALTLNGGGFGMGAIIICNNDGTGLNVAHSFQGPAGYHPYGNILMASDGNLYGTCYDGGDYGSCTVFRFDPTAQVYTDVYSFDIMHGDYPRSGVVEGPAGKLYGAASGGGTSGGGVIYSYDMNTEVYTDLYNMSGSFGSIPYGNPIFHSDGKLYGLTTSGGLYGAGVIYQFDVISNIYTDVFDFDGTNGSNAKGSLVEGNDGSLYGMTSSGGANGVGTLFSFNPSEGIFTKLVDFTAATGSIPQGTLTLGTDGKLYGMTSAGGVHSMGVLFSYNPVNGVYTDLFDFSQTDGATPLGKVMQSGNILCGSTSAGGDHGMGVMFNFDMTNGTYTKVLDFDGNNGANPNGGFLEVIMNGTASQQFSSSTTIYPSPATEELNISFGTALKEQATFNLMDASGRVVYTSVDPVTSGSKKIDVRSLPAGNYMIEVRSGNDKFTRQIIKE